MDLKLCETAGEVMETPTPHRCICGELAGHDATGANEKDWHRCPCGVRWTDTRELASFEITDEELLTIDEFLKVADYAKRMSAFSVDVGGELAQRVGALLRKVRGDGG